MSFKVGDLVQVLTNFSSSDTSLVLSTSVKDAVSPYRCNNDYDIDGSKLNAQVGEVQCIIDNSKAVVVYLFSLCGYRRFHCDLLQVVNT